MSEHPVEQAIKTVRVRQIDFDRYEEYSVGLDGVTWIEATIKSAEYSNIPYIRIWKGRLAYAEYCQHKLEGLYFDEASR